MAEPTQPTEPQNTEQPANTNQPFEIPVLALQNLTLFPETVVPLGVGRPRSVSAVEAALATPEKLLGCITVRPDRADDTDARREDLYEVGTLVMIKRMELTGEAMRIVVQGSERIKVLQWKQEDPHLRAVVQILPEPTVIDAEQVEATKRNVQQMIQEALALLPNVPTEVRVAVLGSADPVRLAYFLGSVLNLGAEEEQRMLGAPTTDELLRVAHANLARELEIMQLRSKIASEAQTEMDKQQRDYVRSEERSTRLN